MLYDAIIIFRKEMRNLAKDKRTLMLIIVLPLLLLPAIFGTMEKVTDRQQRVASSTIYSLDIENIDDPRFEALLARKLLFSGPDPDSAQQLTIVFPENYLQGNQATVEVHFDSTSTNSSFAANQIEAALLAYSDLLAEETLKAHGLSTSDIRSIQVARVDTAPEEARGSGILAILLPYLILIYIFSGSMNIGLDTTAGERERGSLASILVNQVSRSSIALGKVMYVIAAALISSISSFAGIMIAFQVTSFGGGAELATNLSVFSAENVAGLLLTLLSISTLAAAIVVLLGSFAKTVKEGGTYILPVYLVVIMIGIASMQMDASAAASLSFVPLVNTVFILKEILLAQISLPHILIMLGVNGLAAALVIGAIARLFNSEKILDTT